MKRLSEGENNGNYKITKGIAKEVQGHKQNVSYN